MQFSRQKSIYGRRERRVARHKRIEEQNYKNEERQLRKQHRQKKKTELRKSRRQRKWLRDGYILVE